MKQLAAKNCRKETKGLREKAVTLTSILETALAAVRGRVKEMDVGDWTRKKWYGHGSTTSPLGFVYTTVLNPMDYRTNLHIIKVNGQNNDFYSSFICLDRLDNYQTDLLDCVSITNDTTLVLGSKGRDFSVEGKIIELGLSDEEAQKITDSVDKWYAACKKQKEAQAACNLLEARLKLLGDYATVPQKG